MKQKIKFGFALLALAHFVFAAAFVAPGLFRARAAQAAAASVTQTIVLRLSWQDNSPDWNGDSNTPNASEDGFRVYRCTGPGCQPVVQLGVVGRNVTSFVDTIAGDLGGVTYGYAVSAYNATGESSKTPPAYATTARIIVVNIPAVPTGPVATIVNTTVNPVK